MIPYLKVRDLLDSDSKIRMTETKGLEIIERPLLVYFFVSLPVVLDININNMRVCVGRFFEGRVFPKRPQLNIYM